MQTDADGVLTAGACITRQRLGQPFRRETTIKPPNVVGMLNFRAQRSMTALKQSLDKQAGFGLLQRWQSSRLQCPYCLRPPDCRAKTRSAMWSRPLDGEIAQNQCDGSLARRGTLAAADPTGVRNHRVRTGNSQQRLQTWTMVNTYTVDSRPRLQYLRAVELAVPANSVGGSLS